MCSPSCVPFISVQLLDPCFIIKVKYHREIIFVSLFCLMAGPGITVSPLVNATDTLRHGMKFPLPLTGFLLGDNRAITGMYGFTTGKKRCITGYYGQGSFTKERSVVPFVSARLSWFPLMVNVFIRPRDAR